MAADTRHCSLRAPATAPERDQGQEASSSGLERPRLSSPSQQQQENSTFLWEACHTSARRKAQITISFRYVLPALSPPLPVNLRNKSLLCGVVHSLSAYSRACLRRSLSQESPSAQHNLHQCRAPQPAQQGQIPVISAGWARGQPAAPSCPPPVGQATRCPDFSSP